MKRLLLLIILINILKFGYSANTDSLLTVLESEKEDSVKFNTLSLLIGSSLSVDAKQALKFAQNQLELSKNDKQKAKSYLHIGLAHDYQYAFKDAIGNYHNALRFYTQINDSLGMAKVLLNLGIVNYYKGDSDSSIYYYVKTLSISEKINDSKLTSSALGNLGALHKDLGEYKKALKYNLQSLTLELERGVEDGALAASYNNIAMCYRGLKDYGLALSYYEKALKIRRENDDSEGIAIVLTNMGQLYFFQKDFHSALKYNLEALEYEVKSDNELGIAESYVNIGDCYYELGEIEKSIEYLEKALITSEKFKIPELTLATLDGLSTSTAKNEDFEKAYLYNSKYSKLQDSLFQESRMKQIKELEAQYDIEHAEKENEILKKENTINSLQLQQKNDLERNLYVGIVLIVLILVLVVYAYVSNRKASKRLALRNNRIQLMNEDLSLKNKSITDSIIYAKRIQEAILPEDKFVKSCLKDSFVIYKPKDIVSGDFYWMEKVKDDVLFAAVDCTGHGVPGAFMSIVGNNGLNKAVIEKNETSPAKILNLLNQFVENSIQNKENSVTDGMDISLCNLNIDSKILKYAGAFNPLYLVRDREVISYDADKQAIGGANTEFTEQKIQLQEGDICYIFTDGYVDQFGGENDKKFNKKRFREALVKINLLSMEEQKMELERIFEDWKGNQEQLDDICILGFKI